MRRTINYLAIALLIFVSTNLKASEIDSLKQSLKTAPDSLIFKTYQQIADLYFYIDYDSALHFYNLAKKVAIKSENSKEQYVALRGIGIIYNQTAKYKQAIEVQKECLKIAEQQADSTMIASVFGNLGNSYFYMGNVEAALNNFYNALKIFELIDNKKGIALSNGTIGNLYMSLLKYDKALENFQKSYSVFVEIGAKQQAATSLMNIGIIYKNTANYNEALEYLNKAYNEFRELNDKLSMANCLGNQGNVYKKLGDYNRAIEKANEALAIYSEFDAKKFIIITLHDISQFYFSQKNYKIAKDYAEKALLEAQNSPDISLSLFVEIYNSLYLCSKNLGLLNEALEAFEKYHIYSDSISTISKAEVVEELITKYETEKIEKKNELLEKENALQIANIKQKTILQYALIIVIVLITLMIIILYNRFIIKKKANNELLRKNEEILQQKEEIAAQRDEIEAQRDEIEAQRDEIEAQRDSVVQQRDFISKQNREITASIHYAGRIQSAALPPRKYLENIVPDYFILFKPRDIVSGDFFWFRKIENYLIVACADCTGHGVPGAFMSMLGTAYLNEITHRKDVTDPAGVLNILRTQIKTSLHQTGAASQTRDGMDISLCSINLNTNELEFAGAYNSAFIIRKNYENTFAEEFIDDKILKSLECNSCQLAHLKADRMPVGVYKNDNVPFSNKSVKLQHGDILYMFSDGYFDQFGGNDNQRPAKFLKKNLLQLLINNCTLPMAEQKAELEKTHQTWKGNFEQIDDILIIGIEI